MKGSKKLSAILALAAGWDVLVGSAAGADADALVGAAVGATV